MGGQHLLLIGLKDLIIIISMQNIVILGAQGLLMLMESKLLIKMSGSELQCQEEAACAIIFRSTWQLQWLIDMDGRSKFLIFKMLWLSCYYSYHLIYYKPSTSYRMKPTAEGSIKPAQPFLKTRQSTRFGACFHGYGQYSIYTYINTLLTTILANTFMLWWIILENIILIHLPTLPIWAFKLTSLTMKLFQ